MSNEEIKRLKGELTNLKMTVELLRGEYTTTVGRFEANIDDVKERISSLEKEIYGMGK